MRGCSPSDSRKDRCDNRGGTKMFEGLGGAAFDSASSGFEAVELGPKFEEALKGV